MKFLTHMQLVSLVTFGSFVLASTAIGTGSVAPNTDAKPSVELPSKSSYSNTNNRPDPFLPVKLKGAKSADSKAVFDDRDLHLQGILWHPTNPVAIVNRQRLFLNEPATLKLSSGDTTVRAVTIERDRVVLKIDNRQVELQIER